MISLEQAKKSLTDPVASIRVPFLKGGDIDFDALRNLVEFVITEGSVGTVMLTFGDSLYSLLTDNEVAAVTKVVADQTRKRAMVIAADRQWPTVKEIDFADYAAKVGADMLMVLPPDWARSCTEDTFVEHYAAVAQHIGVMVVTNVFLMRNAPDLGLKVIERLCNDAPDVLAVKDDICNVFARKLGLLAHDRMALIAGGQKQHHLNMLPYGCDGYLSTFATFKPQVAKRYWRAIEHNDLTEAAAVIRDIDMPFFDFIAKLPGGFDAGIHAAMELFGITKRYRRKPYYTLDDENMERLADFFRTLKLL